MKHATEAALKPIQKLIGELRRLPGMSSASPESFM